MLLEAHVSWSELMKRIFHFVAVILSACLSLSVQAAITYQGVSANPVDGGTNNEGAPNAAVAATVTPPASTCAGALLLMWTHSDATGRTPVIVTSGGQTWATLSSNSNATSGSLTWLWARYNGTWSGSLSVKNNTTAWASLSAGMVVFCPTNSANTWEIDVAQATSPYSSPASPYNVSIGGQIATTASTVSVGLWTSTNASQWGSLTSGWTYPDSIAQWRNYDTNLSVSMAYKIQTAAGSTGSVTNQQTATGGGAGWTSMITFREVSSAGGNITYQGVSATPADGGTSNEGAPNAANAVVLTPPPSTCAGALLLMWTHSDAANRTPVVVTSGGQTWNTLASNSDATAGSLTWLWARFNGSWSDTLSVKNATTGWSSLSVGMTVFCPSNASNTWGVDVGRATSAYASPSSPYSVTIGGQTATASSTVSVALWTSTNASQWGSLSGSGWTNPGATTQWRNTDTNLSVSLAYKIQASAAATGNVTRSQTSATGGAGWTSIITFKEIGGGPPPPAIKFNPGHYIGNFPGAADGCGGFRFDCSAIKQQHLDRIAEICSNPYIRGLQVSGNLRAFESTQGDYSAGFAALDDIVSAAAACNKHIMISLWPTVFGGYAPPGYNEFPAYVVDGGGTTGLGFYSTPPGNAGLVMRTWIDTWSNHLIRVLNAYGDRYNSNPYVEMTVLAETAVQVNCDTGDCTYSDAALYAHVQQQIEAIRPHWANTSVRLALNYTDSVASTTALLADAVSRDVAIGAGDIDVTNIIDGNMAYVGHPSFGGTDYRCSANPNCVPFVAEWQAPEHSENTFTAMFNANLDGYTASQGGTSYFQAPTYAPYFIWTTNGFLGPPYLTIDQVISNINAIQGKTGNMRNSTRTAPGSVACPDGYAGGCTSIAP